MVKQLSLWSNLRKDGSHYVFLLFECSETYTANFIMKCKVLFTFMTSGPSIQWHESYNEIS